MIKKCLDCEVYELLEAAEDRIRGAPCDVEIFSYGMGVVAGIKYARLCNRECPVCHFSWKVEE